MKLTPQFKEWLVKNADVAADADDDAFKAAAAKCLVDGTLTAEKMEELSKDADDEKAAESVALLKSIKGLLEQQSTPAPAPKKSVDEEEPKKEKAAEPTAFEKAIASIGFATSAGDDEKGHTVRVKEAADQYSTTKSAMLYPETTKSGQAHPNAGRPVKDFTDGRSLDEPSELDKAVAGAWGQFMTQAAKTGSKTIAFAQLPQHTKELVCHAIENEKWGGSSDGGDFSDIDNRKLTPSEQKALIDDSTSGGLEAAPIVFDDQVISAPLLYGELYPLVNVVNLDRGRRVEGVATGNVTASWGGVDDTAISLFNTASYVSAFDTTIFRWEGAIRIGLDFLSDTPINFGAHITAQYGERLLEDLDDVIAAGNGTTQPEGVINKSGTTSVTFSATTSLGNYESLRFGVPKNEHRPNVKGSAVFIGTETSYQRARAIPVGTGDARRLGGMDYDSYSWMQRPYKINESLTNAQICYVLLARYRMYRRRGLTMRTSTEGDTLIRNNEMLMVAMARYGGQLERGAVAAVTTDAPA